MTLIIVDVQNGVVNEDMYCFDEFVFNVQALIQIARQNNIEVVYVSHDDGPDEVLTKGNIEFEIYDKFKPMPNEKVFIKEVNSAFKDTGLREYLNSKDETTVIIAGLQTDYCIDATVKAAFEHGFRVIVPTKANTTVTNGYMSAEDSYKYYNEFIWPRRYAECISMNKALDVLKR